MESVFSIISYLFYVAVCCTCIKVSRFETKEKINITSMFTLPYLLICTFQEFVCLAFDFYVLPDITYWLLNSFFVLITCLMEVALKRICNPVVKYGMISQGYSYHPVGKTFLLMAGGLVAMSAVSTILMVKDADMTLLLQDDFQDDFGESSGGNFYSRLVTIILAVYFLGINKSRIGYLVGVLCFIPHIVVNTKGVIFIPIIAILFTRIIIGRISNIRRTFLILGGAGTFIFFFSYMMEYFTYGENPLTDVDRWGYIFEKLIVYTTAGVQEFAINIKDGISHNPAKVNITMTPIHNFFIKFTGGESISCINEEIYRSIGTLPNFGRAYSNVNGYIGTLYLFNGFLGSVIYHMFLVVEVYMLKLVAYSMKRPFWIALYSLFLSAFFLAWFDFYFMQTFWTYFIVLSLFLDFLSDQILKSHTKMDRLSNLNER